METITINPASSPVETATGTEARIEARPSGEFAKILHARPAQAENPDGKSSDGQDGEQPSAGGKEISLLLFSMPPVLLPEGQKFSGENGLGAASSGSQYPRENGPVQISAVVIPEAGAKSDSPAIVPQEGFNGNPASLSEDSFSLGLPPDETSLKDASNPENFPPAKGTTDSSAGETERLHTGDSQPWQNAKGGEAFLENLKNSTKGDAPKFDSEISANEKDLFLSELKSPESFTPENSPKGEPSGNSPAPVETSAGVRPSAEARFEGAWELNQPSKAGVPEQISQKMVWSLGQHQEKFRLTLDPPNLGSIYMEVQRDKEQVKATLWAENPNTKQILESNQLSIQKIIETEGFSLESFNVFVEQDLGAFQESRERMQKHSDPAASNLPAEGKAELNGGPAAPALFAKRGIGGLRSIDLII